jgi:hypothetical protein
MGHATWGSITILACAAETAAEVARILVKHLNSDYSKLSAIELGRPYECALAGVRLGFSDRATAALARLPGVTAIVEEDPAHEFDGELNVVHDGDVESWAINGGGGVVVPSATLMEAIEHHEGDLEGLIGTLRRLAGESDLRSIVEAIRDAIQAGTTVSVLG